MAFEKLKNVFSGNDEKYEILYYKYSKLRLENQKLKQKSIDDMAEHKGKVHYLVAKHLIEIQNDVALIKADSFKIKATSQELQTLLIDINKADKNLKKVLTQFSIEEISAEERFYDPEFHDVASYQDSKGMKNGTILKTIKKGYKYKNKIIQKPKVLVTKSSLN